MAIYLLCDRGFLATSTIATEAALARTIRFHENLPAAEDTDFAIRAALAGTRFVMAEEPGVIWRDIGDPNRLSAGRRCASMREWIEGLRPRIPAKAYYGCLGWAYAKYAALIDRKDGLEALSQRGRPRLLPAFAGRHYLPSDFPVGCPLPPRRRCRDRLAQCRLAQDKAQHAARVNGD